MKKLTLNYSNCPKCNNRLKRIDKLCVICGNKQVVDKPKTTILWSIASILSLAILFNVSQFAFNTLCPAGVVEGMNVQCSLAKETELVVDDKANNQQPLKHNKLAQISADIQKQNQRICADDMGCVLAENVNLDEIDDPEIRALYRVHQDQAKQLKKIKIVAGSIKVQE